MRPDFIASRLSTLDPYQFVTLCNGLVTGVARTAGIDVSHLKTNLALLQPDGGLDASCVDAPVTVGRLIPANNVGYQFKSGRGGRSPRDVARDDIVRKPRVCELLDKGNSFVYLAAGEYSDRFEDDVVFEVRKQGQAVNDGQILVIAGYALAEQLQAYPARVAHIFGLDERLSAFEDWAARERLTNPFRADAAVVNRVSDFLKQFAADASRVRIVGAPGDGKTRTVLEALRGSPLESTVLYADQVDDVAPSLLGFLKSTPDIQCTLVVDEVDDASAEDLFDRFSIMPGGVRLILIGLDASGRPQPRSLQVEGLSEELLVSIVEAIAPGLPHETAQDIARVCERSPKLAVLLARRIREEPALADHHIRLGDKQIQGMLDRYMPLTEKEMNALSAVALLERLGWTHEAEDESVRVYEMLGLNVADSRRIVERLHEQYGIAPLAGRFRYLSPRMLADHLAARQLSSWPRAQMVRFLGGLTTPMAESFARRMRALAAVLPNRAAVEEVILGDQGPFRELADLETGRLSVLLRQLAGPFRQATIRALGRVLEPASDQELREARASRRDLVWALDELLWPEDTFEQAAKLMLRLAVAENESYGNNATGVFIETFQTMLGRTAAPLEPRLRVLRFAAKSNSTQARTLAAKALGQAMVLSMISRMGMPPKEIPGMPDEAWRPPTYGDWWNAIVAYLGVLEPLLNDQDVEVRKEAAEALAKGIEAAVQFPRVIDAWVRAARTLSGAPYEIRSPILSAVEWRLQHVTAEDEEGDGGSEEGKAQVAEATRERLGTLQSLFQELKGEDFSSTFRWVLGLEPWRFYLPEQTKETKQAERDRESLARQVIDSPALMDTEWEWLVSLSGQAPEMWFELLGRLDVDAKVFPALLKLTEAHDRAIGWLSIYETGRAKATGAEGMLEARAEELGRLGRGGLQVFDLLLRSGYSETKLGRVVELFRTVAVPGRHLRNLTFSGWRGDLKSQDVRELVDAALVTAEGASATVQFLGFYLHFSPGSTEGIKDIAIRALRATLAEEGAGIGAMDEWAEVAKRLANAAPYEITQLVLERLAGIDRFHNEELSEALATAWEAGDKERLFHDFYSPRIEARDLIGWKLRSQLERFRFDELGSEFLLEWVSQSPESRAYALAQLIGSPGAKVSDLHGGLLERFGDQGVGEAFYSDLVSGVFMGSAADRTRGLIAEAERWLDDARPVVREWAAGVVRSLERMLSFDERREAEERFR